MNICVVSDTHGNIEYLKKLAAMVSGTADILIHLGDNSFDINEIINPGIKIFTVPGMNERIYRDKTTQRRKIEIIDNIKFLLTHSPHITGSDLPGDKSPEELSAEADIVLFGHTHTPSIEIINDKIWINPGHMKSQYDRGSPASYCMINTEKPVRMEIRELLTNKIILDYSI